MLTGRSVIVIVVIVVVLSIVFSTLSLLQPVDQDGLGADSYGTRPHGYRAIFEILEELGVKVDRAPVPPSESLEHSTTVVLWGPQAQLVDLEPTYLRRLGQWARQGGQIVFAPENMDERRAIVGMLDSPTKTFASKSAQEEIGLPKIGFEFADLTDTATAPRTAGKRKLDWKSDEWSYSAVSEQMKRARGKQLRPARHVVIEGEGDMASIVAGAGSMVVPETLQVLKLGDAEPSGRLTVRDGRGKAVTLAASFPLGAGRVILVGDVNLFENHLIAQGDNAVIASRLLTDGNRSVWFDEFYHGLTIRGQPLYLLTYGAYALFVLFIIAATAAWVWRGAVFLGPPLEPAPIMRRTLAEYVDAMARFFDRGSTSYRFLLGEVRAGVLNSLGKKLNLRPGPETAERVAGVLARRDPQAAQQLLSATQALDELLSQPARPSTRRTLEALKGIDACL